ncbi:hypothetical protein CP97_14764 [Aurantiacibacter atlanticus]|uniref:Uncharacterized protein n=1 Tax=Aurantiacibacter atlanticus TaxID=1648404 RepID=A0A161IUA4_9SPHN|nr:hypothetical protein CP97_14764 [Aurantiacibacter atlanticus]
MLVIEDLLDTHFEKAGNAEGQRERWIVLAGLNRIHGLPRHIETTGQLRLAPIVHGAKNLETVIHWNFLADGIIWSAEFMAGCRAFCEILVCFGTDIAEPISREEHDYDDTEQCKNAATSDLKFHATPFHKALEVLKTDRRDSSAVCRANLPLCQVIFTFCHEEPTVSILPLTQSHGEATSSHPTVGNS